MAAEQFREQVLINPHLAALLKALIGQEARATSTSVAFGQGNQFGDITIRDVVGGHQFQLNIYHDSPQPPPFASASTPRQRKPPRSIPRILARSRLPRTPGAPAPSTDRHLRAFLCHAAVDKATVRALYQRLRAAHVAPWLDEEELLPGQDWRREIPRAVEAADVVLVCLSPNAQGNAGYLQHEITFALDIADRQPPDRIFLIPLRLEACAVPERLARWQWVNLYEPDGFSRLIRALQVRAAELGAHLPQSLPPIDQTTGKAPSASTRTPHLTDIDKARIAVTHGRWQQAVVLYERLLSHGELPDSDIRQLEHARRALQQQEPRQAGRALRHQQVDPASIPAVAIDTEQCMADLALLLDQHLGQGHAASLVSHMVTHAHLRPGIRRRIGALAGRLGDRRYPIQIADWRHELSRRSLNGDPQPSSTGQPAPYWCYVSGGSYLIGGWDAEQAGSLLHLAPFWVARFAVTVDQYEPFVAVGYSVDAQRWWEPASWRWKQSGAGVTQPRWWDETPYRGENQPVIGVSWHEATAFCAWLHEQLADLLPAGYQLRLPTEAEWEAAAAWGGEAQRRAFPWGAAPPTATTAIFRQAGVEHPAPVGCCPLGAAACGALDMVGNTWELTTSDYERYPDQSNQVVTVLRGKPVPWRGGSWQSDEAQIGCSQRFGARPDRSFTTGGFRIIVGPAR